VTFDHVAREKDGNFIFSSWLKSWRPYTTLHNGYFTEQHDLIEKLIINNYAIVARVADDPTSILGYVVWGKSAGNHVVHYVYVKHIYRRMGIGTDLLKDTFDGNKIECIHATHVTPRGRALCDKAGIVVVNATANDFLSERCQ
jgi:GNAT superfamily N-acetyltransferase